MDSSDPRTFELSPKTVDDLFSVLSNEACRHVIRYFQQTSDSTATFDSLVDFSVELAGESVHRERRAIVLHHTALPKLDDVGVLGYDGRGDTVTYHGHPVAELLVSRATRLDESQAPDGDRTKAIVSHLEDAIRAEDEKRKNFHIRGALQYLHLGRNVTDESR